MEICQDIMQFIEDFPPEEETQTDEEVAYKWETSQQDLVTDQPNVDIDDEDYDHPNVIYVNE